MTEASRPPSTGDIGAVDPARGVRAQEQHHRRDVAGGPGAADARNVAVDAGVAQHFAELREDRRLDRAGAHRIDADAAVLEQLLVRGAERPQQQQLLGDGIAFLVPDVMVGNDLWRHPGKPSTPTIEAARLRLARQPKPAIEATLTIAPPSRIFGAIASESARSP